MMEIGLIMMGAGIMLLTTTVVFWVVLIKAEGK